MLLKNLLARIGTVFVGIATTLWLFCVILERLEIMTFSADHPTWSYVASILICCMLTAIVVFWSYYLNRPLVFSQSYKKVRSNLYRIDDYTRNFRKEKSYFKMMFIDWRMQTESRKLGKVNAGKITVEAKQVYDYGLYVFRSIISLLQEGDEYIGLCDMKFWWSVDFGSGYFMPENLKATNRGVKIKRIIIVKHTEVFGHDKMDERNEIIRVATHLKELAKSNESEFYQMETFFYLHDDAAYRSSYPTSFALIQSPKHNDYLVMEPELENEVYDNSVDMYFSSKGENKAYRDRMAKFEELYRAKDRIKTIDQMVDILKTETQTQ